MNKLIIFLIFSVSQAHANVDHEKIVTQLQHNKVGKAPQRGKNSPHPKYNKFSEVFPKAKKKHRKHHRKTDYSKGVK